MVRTRFAPSPTGYMHIGNLRTALYEYLIAKSCGGQFILRIEDTDQERYVEGATDIIYQTLETTGLIPDESPRNPGPYGPYIQSERKGIYLDFAIQLIEKGQAYYCFCTKNRLDSLRKEAAGEEGVKYDRHCLHLSKEEIENKLQNNTPYVIRQKMPTEGSTTFHDEVFGDITVENTELDDQILIKSDGLPTYNFANVVDDHLMEITHVIRGTEYLSSTPKYNLLYTAFGWDVPTYIHVPPVMKSATEKLSKRNGDASFQDLVAQGFLPQAIINYIALLGWSPDENQEIFTLAELIEHFSLKGLSKSPAIFDNKKLTWMNSEYIKNMDFDAYFSLAEPILKENIQKKLDLKAIARLLQGRLELLTDIPQWVDFFDALPAYENDLYIHKKMKTTPEIALDSLESVLPLLESAGNWEEAALHDSIMALVEQKGIKNGQMLWPIRTALSGKPSSPGGAFDLFILLGKEESLSRIQAGISQLKASL